MIPRSKYLVLMTNLVSGVVNMQERVTGGAYSYLV